MGDSNFNSRYERLKYVEGFLSAELLLVVTVVLFVFKIFIMPLVKFALAKYKAYYIISRVLLGVLDPENICQDSILGTHFELTNRTLLIKNINEKEKGLLKNEIKSNFPGSKLEEDKNQKNSMKIEIAED